MSIRDSLRIESPGQVAFAAAMIFLGVMGLVTGKFTQIRRPECPISRLPSPQSFTRHAAGSVFDREDLDMQPSDRKSVV